MDRLMEGPIYTSERCVVDMVMTTDIYNLQPIAPCKIAVVEDEPPRDDG